MHPPIKHVYTQDITNIRHDTKPAKGVCYNLLETRFNFSTFDFLVLWPGQFVGHMIDNRVLRKLRGTEFPLSASTGQRYSFHYPRIANKHILFFLSHQCLRFSASVPEVINYLTPIRESVYAGEVDRPRRTYYVQLLT